MKQIEMLATAPLMPGVMQALGDTYMVHRLWSRPTAPLCGQSRQPHRGIATNGSVGASAALLDQLPALEIVRCFCVGTMQSTSRVRPVAALQ